MSAGARNGEPPAAQGGLPTPGSPSAAGIVGGPESKSVPPSTPRRAASPAPAIAKDAHKWGDPQFPTCPKTKKSVCFYFAKTGKCINSEEECGKRGRVHVTPPPEIVAKMQPPPRRDGSQVRDGKGDKGKGKGKDKGAATMADGTPLAKAGFPYCRAFCEGCCKFSEELCTRGQHLSKSQVAAKMAAIKAAQEAAPR